MQNTDTPSKETLSQLHGPAAILMGLEQQSRDAASAESGRTEEGKTDAGSGTSDLYTGVDQLDLHEVMRRHPKGNDFVNGLVGAKLEPEREALRAQAIAEHVAEQNAKTEQTRLDDLKKTDAWAYVSEEDRIKAEAEQSDRLKTLETEAHGRGVAELQGFWDDAFRQLATSELPKESLDRLTSKQYPETVLGRLEFLKDYTKELKQSAGTVARQADSAATKEAIREERLSTRAAAAVGRPSLGGGSAIPPPSTPDLATMTPLQKLTASVGSLFGPPKVKG